MSTIPIPKIEPAVPHEEPGHELLPIMNHERILGALIWAVWHDQLEDDLIRLVDTLPREYIRCLRETEEDLDVLVQMTQGSNLAPKVRKDLIKMLKAEIRSTLKRKGSM